MKKTAVLIYPNFSMYEISSLTALFWFHGKEMTVFASSLSEIKTEDGFTLIADKLLSDFNREEFDCIILPGISDPFPVTEDEEVIRFLKRFIGDEDIVIGSISSSPMLLAKAGLLKDKKYTSGILEETFEEFKYLPKENVVRKPVVKDGNLITAIGFAFREFAVAVAQSVGVDCPDKIFQGVTREYTEEELTFYQSDMYKD